MIFRVWTGCVFIANGLTRMRYCSDEGVLCFTYKGPLGTQPPGFLPWFRVPGRRSMDLNIVFGHWGALGYYREPGITAPGNRLCLGP